MEIQSVGIKEFRANLYKYTQKQDLIALQEAVQKITQLLQTQSVSEDEIFADFQKERRSNPQ
jgi:hypothetical protein